MSKPKHNYRYYYRKAHIQALRVAIKDFLFEGYKLVPIAQNYSALKTDQKDRYQRLIEEMKMWHCAMKPEEQGNSDVSN